ncbi:hypothetical protein [Escherichia phage ST20]|nr:hypothetical protein [Escherichia phage ST20]
MVQRYLLQGGLIGPHDDGDWVGYEDYKELDDSFQDYITTTDMEIEGLVSRLAEVNAELQKYKDQFPDYVECANCGSITHVEGAEDATGPSGCQIGEHDWALDPDEDYFVCRSCGETT